MKKKKDNKILKLLKNNFYFLIVILIGIVTFITVNQINNKLSEPEQKLLDIIEENKNTFKNPESLKVVSAKICNDDYSIIEITANNSFGAETTDIYYVNKETMTTNELVAKAVAEQCYKEECNTYNGLVLIQGTSTVPETLMLLDYDFAIDNTTEAYKSIQTIKTFMSTFATLEYSINNRTYTATMNDVTPTQLTENRLVFQIPSEASNADFLNLRITIRNRCYIIKLI